VTLDAALHRAARHPEGAGDLDLRRGAVDDELRGEKPEARQIVGGVGEDRQVAVEINRLPVAALAGQRAVDRGLIGREHGQLHLGHDARVPCHPALGPARIGPALIRAIRLTDLPRSPVFPGWGQEVWG